MEEPQSGEKYRHFKGEDKVYEIMAVARDCEDPQKKHVIYKSLYEKEDFSKGTIWSRPLEDFIGFKELDGNKIKRFTKIE